MFGWLINLLVAILTIIRNVVCAVAGENAAKMIDWIAWRVSGKHKIQWICKHMKGVEKMRAIEECFTNSRYQALKDYRTYNSAKDLSNALIQEKEIKPAKDPEFIARINSILNPMCEINKITKEAHDLKKTLYDSSNSEHEERLMLLWSTLQPDRQLDARRSEMWADIGFQGHDPATDFRGMGMLGLETLLYISQQSTSAQHLLAAAGHPQYGFSLAITSINMTAECVKLLENGPLRNHFYYKCLHGGSRQLTLEDFYKLQCQVLLMFVDYWQAAKPRCIMEFNIHKAAFVETLKATLESAKPLIERQA